MFVPPIHCGLLPTFPQHLNVLAKEASAIDILWVIVCSGLVFVMQPGFMCLESGLTRSKNSINVAVKNFADFGISVALFWMFGYALAFGSSYGGLVGTNGFFLALEADPETAAFFLFQTMFCGTATTIVSGAVAERMKFLAYLGVSCLSSGLVYPLFSHWAWARTDTGEAVGWLGQLGFSDFAGSTVVHSIGGWIALAALVTIGPRFGRFPRKGEVRKIQGSNLPLSVLGTMLLWLGWLGFNGGSTLTLDGRIAGILVHTVLAGVSGMLAAMILGWQRNHVPEVELLLNGSLAGLVSVTASCSTITTPAAVLIGAVGGIIVVFVRGLLEWLEIDDAIDAVPVHLGGGIWGTIALGLFGAPAAPELALNRLEFFLIQVIGIIVAGVWSFGVSFLVLKFCDRFWVLRVTVDEEQLGLNVTEHRATTEIYDLFKVMDSQAQDPDLSLRVPVEPFTEVGQIATRYNQVMEALEEAVNRNNAIVTTARDAIITFSSQDYKILTTNPSTERDFGYSKDQLLRRSMLDLVQGAPDPPFQLSPITPAAQTSPAAQTVNNSPTSTQDSQQALLAVLEKGRGELNGIRADGSVFPIEASVTLTEIGNSAFYTATLRDISEQKRAQRELERANQEISSLNSRLQAENVRMGAELEVSRRLQAMLLPKPQELSDIDDLDIVGYMDPAAEVGGDYYDVLIRGDRVQMGIGDVTGHGLESGVLTIMVQTAVRTLLENNETDLKRFLETINRAIYGNLNRMDCDKNLTLSLLDYKDGVLTLCGQHEEVILARHDAPIECIDTIDLGFPLGLEQEISAFVDKIQIPLNPQDVVVLYTDGITEAENAAGELFGLDRLCDIIAAVKTQSAQQICDSIIHALKQHIGQHIVHDDITLLILKRK